MTTQVISKEFELQALQSLAEVVSYVPAKRQDLSTEDFEKIDQFKYKLIEADQFDAAGELVEVVNEYDRSLLKIKKLTKDIEFYQIEIKSLIQELEELHRKEANKDKWLQSGSLFTKVVSYLPGPVVAGLGLAGIELTLPVTIGIAIWYLSSTATEGIDSTLKLDEKLSVDYSQNDQLPIPSKGQYKEKDWFKSIKMLKQIDKQAPITKLVSELISHDIATPELLKTAQDLQKIKKEYQREKTKFKDRLDKKGAISIVSGMIPSASSMPSFPKIPFVSKIWGTQQPKEESSTKEEVKPQAE